METVTAAEIVSKAEASVFASSQMALPGFQPTGNDWLVVNQILASMHYLGPINRGIPYRDEFGVLVLANPSSRRLPHSHWLELVRWLLVWDEERRIATVETRLPLAPRTSARGDNRGELLRSLSRAYRGALSRVKLALGANVAPPTTTSERAREVDARREG